MANQNQIATATEEVTLINVLDIPEGRKLVDMLEEYISDGVERFEFEIGLCIKEIFELTGYRWTL
tara:strand:- start:97 stop:291 length:195 start_codon:yes stop_codon:yes gene_type:complete